MISEKSTLILAINMYFRNSFPALLFQAEIIQYQPLFTMLNYSICSLIWDWELSKSFTTKKLHKLRAQTLESLCYFETFNCQWIKTLSPNIKLWVIESVNSISDHLLFYGKHNVRPYGYQTRLTSWPQEAHSPMAKRVKKKFTWHRNYMQLTKETKSVYLQQK